MNNAKEHLDLVRRLYKQAVAKQATLNVMRGKAADPRTAKLSQAPRGGPAGSAGLDAPVAAILDVERQLGDIKRRLRPLYRQAKAAIERDVDDPDQRRVLTLYYLEGKSIGAIQDALGCSYMRCMSLHDRAVRHLHIRSDDSED